MKKMIFALAFIFTNTLFAAPDDPTWFNRPSATRIAEYMERDLDSFHREVVRTYGQNTPIARHADTAYRECRNLVWDLRSDVDFRRVSSDFDYFDRRTMRNLAQEYRRIPRPTSNVEAAARRLDRDWQDLRYEFSGNGGGGGGGQGWHCIASEVNGDEHWLILNGSITFGHYAQGHDRRQAEEVSMDACRRSHGRCFVRQCWQ